MAEKSLSDEKINQSILVSNAIGPSPDHDGDLRWCNAEWHGGRTALIIGQGAIPKADSVGEAEE